MGGVLLFTEDFYKWLENRRLRMAIRRRQKLYERVMRQRTILRNAMTVDPPTTGQFSWQQQQARDSAAARARHPTSAPRNNDSGNRDKA